MAGKSSWDQANRRQKLGLVWRIRTKISQIIKDYFYLPFFLLIILWGECLSTLERWEPQWRFLDRWVVKTGFCQGEFTMTNEQQRHLKEKLISEMLEEVESIKTS
jgi:hypothetical protein